MAHIDLKSLSVLAVDDDTFMLDVILLALGGLGITNVTTASNGEEALKFFDGLLGKVDVLLCDLNMPGMDGVELLRHIAERGYSGGVVVVSGEDKRVLGAVESLAQANHLRILGTLEKPVSRQAMEEVLRKLEIPIRSTPRVQLDPIGEEDIGRGIDGDELVVFFQPKLHLATRRIAGVEALVRWNHPTRGLLGPNTFIPIAEKCGLIDALTNVVFDKALRQESAWRAQGLELSIAVNMSLDSLNRYDLPDLIVSGITIHGMNPSHLILELTESRLMQDITRSLDILTRLRLKRIRLSIDDFGTGYSSLEQLRRVPFEELKIDRTFVTGASRDSAARAILESSIKLARQLNMVTVAEGVETQEDWDTVSSLGCDFVQGYFVAKPMPAENLKGWILEWYSGQQKIFNVSMP